MGRPRKLSSSERREAVLSLLRGEEKAEAIGRRLGISAATIGRWRDDFLAGGEAALAGSQADPRDQKIAELEREIADRDQVIGEYTVANRILKKLSDPLASQRSKREMIQQALTGNSARTTQVLKLLGIAPFELVPPASDRQERPGPRPKRIPEEIVQVIVTTATDNPWYGYKRIAVMCRRAGHLVKDRQAYTVMRDRGLLQQKRTRRAQLHQTAKLFELLPQKPNDLWQMDVTYIHIPGWGWRYAVTVIDYYSRYLLACYLTSSYSALEVTHALKLAREEAERLHGPLEKQPHLVTDNGSSFIARRFQQFVKQDYQHVRIQYRTPQQLGLLERFHGTLKTEEVYWRLYDSVPHARECLAEFRERYNTRRPHWALVPAEGGDPLVPLEVYTTERSIQTPRWQSWATAAQAKLEELQAA